MDAIEFYAKIENGLIEIPQEYQNCLQQNIGDKQVRVILLTPANIPLAQDGLDKDVIAQLLANPLSIPDFTPMSRKRIYKRF